MINLNIIWASLSLGFILQVEVAFLRIGILKTESAVLPPLKSVAAMQVETTGVAKSPFPCIKYHVWMCKRIVYRKVFPIPAGLPSKKNTWVSSFDYYRPLIGKFQILLAVRCYITLHCPLVFSSFSNRVCDKIHIFLPFFRNSTL